MVASGKADYIDAEPDVENKVERRLWPRTLLTNERLHTHKVMDNWGLSAELAPGPSWCTQCGRALQKPD